ncbi:MAG TPA: Sec-independent protein translocase subunit TatB [Campylobacterales bacterium]|nr:Sec-independent protein translocase subunit TatB [Campylobacterales bacterium]HHH51704.1 Sec-independent protein translocase subunit TatB [Campylobacterales bacterium]
MFGMGFTEILLIAIVAILFLGPDKLPDAMVKIAKFIKSTKKALTDAKNSIDDELKIAQLKEEAMGYKAKLDEVTDELKGFKNISNPVDDLQEALDMAKGGFKSTPLEDQTPIATQIEPKQEEVVLKKKKSLDKTEKKGDA